MARVEAAERLLDLVIALTHAPGRMTKQQIRARVHGYADATSDQSFERMFERDKDALREMGVPVVTEADPAHEDDVGYRIDTEGYTLPPVTFTPAEVGVLSLAAELWQDATLRPSARRGLTKLRAVGPPAEPDAHAGLALRVRGPEATFSPLLGAIEERRVVTFVYRAASTGQVADRTVEPWRLLSRHRGWYLLGQDRDRGAPRAFRLSRIEGRVRTVGGADAFTVPTDIDPAAILGSAAPDTGVARLAVLPERAAAVRARGTVVTAGPGEEAPAGRDVLEVPYEDTETFAEELTTYAEATLVLLPAPLRESVRRRLRVAAHLDAPADGPLGAPADGGAEVLGERDG